MQFFFSGAASMETTATTTTRPAPYNGRAGGKLQKHPFRQTPATPYDRPASAAPVSALVHQAEAHAGDGAARGGWWLSKLVDPATRMVARGAFRLFSSVFLKRLIARPDASAINLNSPTFELEQFLKQREFTRSEFDRLQELLRSRTMEPIASKPTEIDKAYMSSRSFKISPGSLTAQNQDKIFCNNSRKAFDHAMSPRSAIGVSATPRLTKDNSRIPSTEWASNRKQARKRVMDSGVCSLRPVRRVYQRCKMMLPLTYSNSALKFLNRKSPNLDDQRRANTELNCTENNAVASVSIVPIPPQSSETARKILQELDQPKSSPKEKSSPRSMEEMDSSKFPSVHGNNLQIELTRDSCHEGGMRSSSDQEQSTPSVIGVQVKSEGKSTNFVIDVKSNMESSEISASDGSTSAQKKPSFRISVSDDLLDLEEEDDADDDTTKDSEVLKKKPLKNLIRKD